MAVKGIGAYDDQNIFAKILRGEIPCRLVFDDEWALVRALESCGTGPSRTLVEA